MAAARAGASLSTLALIGIGLALGVRHAIDSDHVVAVTAIAARYKRVGPAALVGVFWGLGHTLTVCTVGAFIILLDLALPPRVGLALELAVGLALIVVGVLNLTGRGGFVSAAGDEGKAQGLRAFVVGLVHGLAGSAAVALMVLATVRDPWKGCAYLFVFGAGTIIGMVLVTIAFASPVALLARRLRWSGTGLRVATGALSVAFGVYVLYEVLLVRIVPSRPPLGALLSRGALSRAPLRPPRARQSEFGSRSARCLRFGAAPRPPDPPRSRE